MHLGNGAITPECGLVALGIAAIGAGAAAVAVRASGFERASARTAAALGAAVFAAQSFNAPILPFSSAHLVGGVLLAWTLGPAIGLLSMSVILGLQAVLLGDGGLLALGANVINMGVVPAFVVGLTKRSIRLDALHPMLTLGAAAFFATLIGAGCISVEVAIGRAPAELDGWSGFAGRMMATHALAGLLEAFASVAIVASLAAASEPCLAGERHRKGVSLSTGAACLVAMASLAVALVGLPAVGIASTAPDAYEASLAMTAEAGHALGAIETPDRLSGLAAAAESWQESLRARQESLLSALSLPGATNVILGSLLAAAGAGVCSLIATRPRSVANVAPSRV